MTRQRKFRDLQSMITQLSDELRAPGGGTISAAQAKNPRRIRLTNMLDEATEILYDMGQSTKERLDATSLGLRERMRMLMELGAADV